MKTVKQKKNFRSAFRNFLTIACVMVIGVLSQSCGASASGTDDQDAASQKVWQSTIDDSIQGIAEQELRKLCTDAEPVWATAVVMDVATGDIKALANLERVDSLDASKGYIEKHNYAISCNETSSVMNVISMLVALEDSIVVDVNERITTGSSWAYSSAYPISDAHAYPDLSVTEVISRSSNIGIAKIITAAYGDNPQAFGERLMGLGMTVDSLGAGIMVDKPVMRFTGNENADRILLSRMSYGYGMAVAPIHILAVYNAIANDNNLLYYLNLQGNQYLSNELFSIIKGEALALRAYMYFDLLRMWGPIYSEDSQFPTVPWRDVLTSEKEPLCTAQELVDHIMADLKEAESLLAIDPICTGQDRSNPIIFLRNRQYRMNLYAVQALQARINLWIGNKEKAKMYAKEVIDAELDEEPVIELGGKEDFENRNYNLPSETLCGIQIFKWEPIDSDFRGLYALYAATSRNTILTDLFDNMSSHNRYTLWSEYFAAGSTRMLLKKYWLSEDISGGSSTEGSKAEHLKIIPLIRLSEVYLIAMEATTDLAEANQLMKTYNDARNVMSVTYENREQLLQNILKEYRREFYAEGQMFYTYKRINAQYMLWRMDEVTENDYILPLPEREITLE